MTIDGAPAISDGAVREQLGAFTAEVTALAALTTDNIDRWLSGAERIHDAAMGKLMFSELNLAMAEFALDLCGTPGLELTPDMHRWQDEWLYARAFTIAGGTSEIMRTMIAERGLGMPPLLTTHGSRRGNEHMGAHSLDGIPAGQETSARRRSRTPPSMFPFTLMRRRYRWRSCSQVKPIPPCTCWASPRNGVRGVGRVGHRGIDRSATI